MFGISNLGFLWVAPRVAESSRRVAPESPQTLPTIGPMSRVASGLHLGRLESPQSRLRVASESPQSPQSRPGVASRVAPASPQTRLRVASESHHGHPRVASTSPQSRPNHARVACRKSPQSRLSVGPMSPQIMLGAPTHKTYRVGATQLRFCAKHALWSSI